MATDAASTAASSAADYLTPGQQRLLSAALKSNRITPFPATTSSDDSLGLQNTSSDRAAVTDPFNGSLESLLYTSTNQPSSVSLKDADLDGLLDDGDLSLEFDADEVNGQTAHTDVDLSPTNEGDIHEKRKSPGDGKDSHDQSAKRREGVDKIPKKPGRKPLTVEPTNKRKAQNRAAQRAFRERKEKHLVDLESKVEELEKASEAANNENGLLKAKIDLLQLELQEYKSKLSRNIDGQPDTMANTRNTSLMFSAANDNVSPTSFDFDFPRFGSLPGGVFGGDNDAHWSLNTAANTHKSSGAQTSNTLWNAGSSQESGKSSQNTSPSLRSDHLHRDSQSDGLAGRGINGYLPKTRESSQQVSVIDDTRSSEVVGSPSRIFRFNSNSASTSSPSAASSSLSQHGNASSCGTSPEPTQHSPAAGNKDNTLDTIKEQGSRPYAIDRGGGGLTGVKQDDSWMTSAGADHPSAMLPGVNKQYPLGPASVPANMDWLTTPLGNQFDPTLFGEYRDTPVLNFGDGDFTGGFFNDALPVTDWSGSMNWTGIDNITTGLTPADLQMNPLERADLAKAGLDPPDKVGAVPPSTKNLLSCDKIWNKLQQSQSFQDGNLDIDSLCTELRAKAKCTESGVAIDQKDVDAAIQRLPTNNPFSRMN